MARILTGLIMFLTSLTMSMTIWFSWEGLDAFKSLVKEFSKETGIRVDVVYIPKNAYEKLSMAWKAGAGVPDLVLLKNDELGKVSYMLERLERSDNLTEKSLEAFTLNGGLLGIPVYSDIGGVFFYRGNAPNARSIEDLVKIFKDEKNALMLPIYGRYYFQVFQRAFGKNTDLYLKDESTKRAIEYILWLRKEVPYLPKDGRSAIGLFMKGEAKVLMFGSFLIPKFLSKHIDFGIMNPPLVEKARNRISPNIDYKGFVVVKGHLNSNVKKFLEFISSKEFQEKFCEKLYKLPTNEKAAKALSEDPIFGKLKEYEKYGKPTPSDPNSWRYYEAINAILKLIMRGVDDPEVLLKSGRKVISGK